MATISKRTDSQGRTAYQVRVRIKGYPQQIETFPRLTDAKRWAAQTEAAIRERRHFKTAEAQKHTLTDAIDRFIASPQAAKRSSAKTAQQLAWWRSKLGPYTLADITPAAIVEARDALLATTNQRGTTDSSSTANRYVAALSRVLSIASREWGWIDSNPAANVARLREPAGRVRFLDDDERQRLLSACRESSNPDLYLAVLLSLTTGGRQMEIMSLRWPHAALTRGLIAFVETKNGERRSVPVVGEALELLKARGKVRRLDTDLVFPGSDPTKPVDLRAPWERALKVAEIANFRWHDLRHTAASYLAMNGATLAEIAEILGHRTLQMVRRYAHLSEQHTIGVIERMNRAVFGDRQ